MNRINSLFIILVFSLTIYSQISNDFSNLCKATEQETDISVPDARFGHSMVYDTHNKKVILFGGSGDYTYATSKRDTWSYDYETNNWTELNPLYSPSRRLNFAMSYDTDNHSTMIFGGNSISSGWELDETWIYDYEENVWSNPNPILKPPGRSDSAMVYDPITKQTILFGGMRDVGEVTYLLNDTWAYSIENNTWTELNPEISPQCRYGTKMVYDPNSELIILFGGNSFGTDDDEKIWTFDPVTVVWESLNVTNRSVLRYWNGLCYDTHENKLIAAFGSDLANPGNQCNNTVVFDMQSNQWEEIEVNDQPSPRSSLSTVYDPENNKTILFGGLGFELDYVYDDLWVYDTITKTWTHIEPGIKLQNDNSNAPGFEIFYVFIGLSITLKFRRKW